MPPPVRRVDIPKGDSKTETRPPGIPTVADRIAQEVVKRYLEPILEPIFHEDSYDTDRADRRLMQFGRPVSEAGGTTGCSTSTYGATSIASIGDFSSRRFANTRAALGCSSMSNAG